MNVLQYEARTPDRDTINQLIELSRLWVEEECSHGMVVNEASDIKEPLIVACEGRRIIGYIFGHFFQQKTKRSYIEIDSDCFEVGELYVLPEYRSRGIGKRLFQMLEEHVRGRCVYMTLATSTKNYKAILKLYVEELGMDFHSAFLIKRMDETALKM